MHNEQLLKYWGPLAGLSEFPGERINGMLQKVKTNRHLYDIDYTMLKQMARLTRVLGSLHHDESQDSHQKELGDILEPEAHKKSLQSKELDGPELAEYLDEAPLMSEEEYSAIQEYLDSTGRQYRSWKAVPHPENAFILPPRARRPLQFDLEGRTYSCSSSHAGNSLIEFYNQQTQSRFMGYIHTILEIPLDGFTKTFILVHAHQDISNHRTPYVNYPRMMCKVVEIQATANTIILETQHIITHLVTWKRPAGTYGIDRETLAVCTALNRGLR
ncbi:hypothetical protein R3P38DRAFT_2496785 [Favolaschia claudopus]|uniref:Uncharacterized protein n=1 Tax=Favolaschia claudopus TaxID=2862362 RepID=A0AAW0E3C7_9AGAR